MRTISRIAVTAFTLTSLLSSLPAVTVHAQQSGVVSGWLHLSARSLSLTGGSNAGMKYDEEYDYQSGLQLAGLSLSGDAAGQQFGLNAAGWGESPLSTLNGWLSKSGLYHLRYGGYNSRYFHTTGSYVDDFGIGGSPYAYTRRGRFADLTISTGKLPDIHIRYDRLRREGTNLLVWNIEREKHLAQTPVDETSSSLQISTSLPLSMATVDLSYSLYHLDNRYGAVVADTSEGLDGRSSELYDYSHILHDVGDLPVMKVNVVAPVGPAMLRFGYSSSSGTIDKSLLEVAEGIDYSGAPLDSESSARGALDRSYSILDGGFSLSLLKGLSTDVSIRRTAYGVEGYWDPQGILIPGVTSVETAVTSLRLMGRMIWTPLRGVSIDIGGANISRTLEEGGAETSETVTADWVGGFTWARHDRFRFRFSHRVADIENPYSRISPTDRNSTSAVLNFMPHKWLTTTIAYKYGSSMRYYSHDSTDPDYYFNTRTSDYRNFSVGLRASRFPLLDNLSGHMTWTRGRLEMTIPIARFAPPSPTIFNYRDVTFATAGGLAWHLKDGIDVVADGYWFRANGQWPLTRSMMRLGVAIDLNVLTLHVDYRSFSLDQVVDDLDDFDASLITFGFSRGF